VADYVSIVRRFAAEFTLQCHCYSCSIGFEPGFPALGVQNQAPYSSRPAFPDKECVLEGDGAISQCGAACGAVKQSPRKAQSYRSGQKGSYPLCPAAQLP
jgi:hypothetical protein